MPVRLLSSSILKWPDAQAVDRAIRRWAGDVGQRHEGVQRIGYFGSYARGNWGVGSDLDVIIVVKSSEQPFEHRAAEWDMTEFPVPVDVLVYTEEEWRSLLRQGRFASTVLKEVVWVFMDPEAEQKPSPPRTRSSIE